MLFIIPVESIGQNKGGVILYNPVKNRIVKEYVHNKQWLRSGWRGGVIHNDCLIATDWQDLHYFDLGKWEYIKSFQKNTFNDLHYLAIQGKRLYVVNTGLDAVEVFKNPLDPNFIKIDFVFEKNEIFKQREINPKRAYNEIHKMRHSCHPNCINISEGFIFVTCFEDHTRAPKSGNLIELNSGRIVLSKYNCHDGNFYNNNFYLSWTRQNRILIVKNLLNRGWPVKVDEKIEIGAAGWWRGMIIHDDILYIFASYGYGKKNPCRMATINLKTKEVKIKILPTSKVMWDTVYQPILWKE